MTKRLKGQSQKVGNHKQKSQITNSKRPGLREFKGKGVSREGHYSTQSKNNQISLTDATGKRDIKLSALGNRSNTN